MKERSYARDDAIADMVFPEPATRRVLSGTRNPTVIEGYVEVADVTTDRTFAVVKEGYELVDHRSVVQSHDNIVSEFPEWGQPTKEIWLSNFGGRMKLRYTFKEMDFEIRPGDVVHPTLESYGSYDTSLAHRTLVGGFRVVCLNGLTVGKVLAEYKRKHTVSLDLNTAKLVIAEGMKNYTSATDLWKNLASRKAFIEEVNAFEILGFNKAERTEIERDFRSKGTVKQWDEKDKEKRQVDINAWDLMNIYTYQTSHKIEDITRATRVNDAVTDLFNKALKKEVA